MATEPADFFTLASKMPAAPAPVYTPAQVGWDAPGVRMDQFYLNHQPSLHDIVEYARNYFNEETQRYEPLIGETETLLTAFLAYVCAELGVIIRSYPGTGKTATANPIFDMIPPESRMRILNLSGKGIWSKAPELNQKRYVYFGEWQKAAENPDVVEIVKDWGEGRAAERSRTDVTKQNDEGGYGEHVTTMPRKPILVTVASADGKDDSGLNEQVLRRYPEVATDPSQNQTKRVIDMKGLSWDPGTEGAFRMTDADKERFRQHLRFMIDTGIKTYVMPGGQYLLQKTMPTDYPISRSMTDIFKAIVNASAKYHFYDRLRWTNPKDEECLVATPADFWYARRVYGNNLMLNCLRVTAVGKEIIAVLPELEARDDGRYVPTNDDKMTVAEIRAALKRERGISLEKGKVSHELTTLTFNCYVEEDRETQPHRYWRSETLVNLDQNLSPEVMRECIEHITEEAKKYPFADEYISRFCTDPIMVRDPLTGKDLNILTDLADIIDRSPKTAAAKPVKEKKTHVPQGAKGTGLNAFI